MRSCNNRAFHTAGNQATLGVDDTKCHQGVEEGPPNTKVDEEGRCK
jgi:hypothetical protein